MRLNQNEDLNEALKRALHLSDRDLLQEILDKDRQMARFKIDNLKNIQIIHKACQSDEPAIVNLLIEYGADVDCQDNKHWTPLIIAAMNGNYNVVNCLVKHGANMSIEDIEGKTAREYAIEALDIELAKP